MYMQNSCGYTSQSLIHTRLIIIFKAFFRGVAAERFCVRNSGAVAVCEVSLLSILR